MDLCRTIVNVTPAIDQMVQGTYALGEPHDPMNRVMLVDMVAALVVVAPANEADILGKEIGVAVQDNPA